MKEPTTQKKIKKVNTGLKLKNITAKNDRQKQFFQIANKFQVISLIGSAGTGKTILALYQALRELEHKEDLKKIYIIRSAVPVRNIGFLPGNKKEKMEEYEAPYIGLCTELYDRSDAYSILKSKGIIEFESTSFLRGTNLNDCVIIFDEAQNAAYNEIYTLLTRVGENTKVFICGDTMQDDLTSERYKEQSGLSSIMKKLDLLDRYHYKIEFTSDDIIRSGFVREFLKITQL